MEPKTNAQWHLIPSLSLYLRLIEGELFMCQPLAGGRNVIDVRTQRRVIVSPKDGWYEAFTEAKKKLADLE